jgi:hypothetical protein
MSVDRRLAVRRAVHGGRARRAAAMRGGRSTHRITLHYEMYNRLYNISLFIDFTVFLLCAKIFKLLVLELPRRLGPLFERYVICYLNR